MNAHFDTHAMVKELLAAGFTGDQAEAVTRAIQRFQDGGFETLATKADLAQVKTDLAQVKIDIVQVKASLMFALSETKNDTLKWVIGAIGAQTVVVLGTVLALARIFAHP